MLDIDHSEGRELDEFVHGIGFKNEIYTQEYMLEIAEEVWKDQPYCGHFNAGFKLISSYLYPTFKQNIPKYSTDIRQAMDLLDMLRKDKFEIKIIVSETYYRIYLRKYVQDQFNNDIDVIDLEAGAKELSTAICRVFLKTILYNK